MRFKHHKGHPAPSEEIIADLAAILQRKAITDFCQFEHQSCFSFGEIELQIEGPWRLQAGDRVVVVGGDTGQLVGETERAEVNAEIADLLDGRTVADVAVDQRGDLWLRFEGGEQLTAATRSSGVQSWLLEVRTRIFVAEWGGLLEKEQRVIPDPKEGFWRVLRGG